MPLNPRQSRFVAAYLLHGIAARAAREAGYSVRTARAIGSENLTKPAISEAVAVGRGELARDLDAERRRVRDELVALAFASLGDCLTWDGTALVLTGPLPPGAVVRRRGSRVTVSLPYKLRALDLLAQDLGMMRRRGRPLAMPPGVQNGTERNRFRR